jgi:hypothetical protein
MTDEPNKPDDVDTSARALSIHALRMTLLSMRQTLEGALALLAAIEAHDTVAPTHMQDDLRRFVGEPSVSPSLAEQAARVFGRVRDKQQAAAAEGGA